MKKLKQISIFLVVSIIFSSMPFSVSAIQNSLEYTVEQDEASVEEETSEETSTEETMDVVTEDEPSGTNKQKYIETISDSTPIVVPYDKALLLGEGGKYKYIEINYEGAPKDLDWTEFDGEYTENTPITFDFIAVVASVEELEHPVVIGSIKSSNTYYSGLTILPGSNIEINAGNEPGIQVRSLMTGYSGGDAPKIKLKINTSSVGILTDEIISNNTDFEIESGLMGISVTSSPSGNPTKGTLNLNQSDIKVRSMGEKMPAIYMESVVLNESAVSATSEQGTGLIADYISTDKDSVLVARSKNDPDGKGIVTNTLDCRGAVTGVAEDGSHGIWVMDHCSFLYLGSGKFPSLTGEAKTGYGILIEPSQNITPIESGILTGTVTDGIGIKCGNLQLGSSSESMERSKLIGIAEKGHGIQAKSLSIVGDNWDVIGEVKQASDGVSFAQEGMPPAVGILVTNNLSVLHDGATIEGAASPEVADSYGIYVGSYGSSNGIFNLKAYVGNKIAVTATGDTGIYADQIQIKETDDMGTQSLVYITANGSTTGMKVAELNINGQGPEVEPNAYRIKATGEHGTGIEIISKTNNPLKIYGASIEATGKLYGIKGKMELTMISGSKIKATGLGTDSVAGIYFTSDDAAATLLNVTIVGSQIIAESEQYGWFSENAIVTILASNAQLQNSSSMVEAIGAEIGMKVSIDQDKYQVDGPLIEVKGNSVRSSAILKAVAKKAIPDQATNSALTYDKVVASVPDGINRGVLVACATITEEYRMKAKQPITTTPVWPYAMGLNMASGMNYEWVPNSNSNQISVEKTLDGIKLINGKGDSNLVISREGNEDPALFADEPIVLLGSVSDNSRAITDSALHQVVLSASFGVIEGNGGGGGGGTATTSTEPEESSTEESTGAEATTSNEIDPDTSTSGSTNEGSNNNEKGTKPSVTWNNGRPNTGDSGSQYVLSTFILVSILSGAYIVILHHKKNRV